MATHPIHARLRTLRKAAKMTQAILARRAKLNPSDLANYETRLIPPLPKLERIAAILKQPLSAFFEKNGGRASRKHR